MRKVIVSTFASLDGVMQAPGGPEEDRTGNFGFGGWMFNAAKKYVASRTLKTLDWSNSVLLGGDVISALRTITSQPGPDLQVIGSGRGKRLFPEDARPGELRLVRSQLSPSGVVMSTYVPGGDVRPGSFVTGEPSEKELARRKKCKA